MNSDFDTLTGTIYRASARLKTLAVRADLITSVRFPNKTSSLYLKQVVINYESNLAIINSVDIIKKRLLRTIDDIVTAASVERLTVEQRQRLLGKINRLLRKARTITSTSYVLIDSMRPILLNHFDTEWLKFTRDNILDDVTQHGKLTIITQHPVTKSLQF